MKNFIKSLFDYSLLPILTITCCLVLTGCENKKTDNKSGNTAKTETALSNEKENTTPTPAAENQESEQPDIPVCFIGNSLIDYGCQAVFLTDIAAGYGRKISVDKLTYGGARLSEYAAGGFIGKKEIKKRLKKADIVVFQDYGGWQGQETYKAIQKLTSWCKKNAAFYYYMYDGDDVDMDTSDYQKLKKLGLKLIPKGQMIDALLEMSYIYEELHMEADFHPNDLNGYMAALVMNHIIFDEKCTDFSKEWFFGEKSDRLAASYAQVIDGLHGDSEQEKWEELRKICKIADNLDM